MSIEVLSESNPVARKEYNCDACDWILNAGIDGFGYSISELRLIVLAKRNKFKVVAGQEYVKQNNKFDGEIYTFRAIPAMHQLCLDHDLYEV